MPHVGVCLRAFKPQALGGASSRRSRAGAIDHVGNWRSANCRRDRDAVQVVGFGGDDVPEDPADEGEIDSNMTLPQGATTVTPVTADSLPHSLG